MELRNPPTFEDAVGMAERYDAVSYRIHTYESVAGGLTRNVNRQMAFPEAHPAGHLFLIVMLFNAL